MGSGASRKSNKYKAPDGISRQASIESALNLSQMHAPDAIVQRGLCETGPNALELLRAVPLFKSFPEAKLTALSKACTRQHFGVGEIVVSQGGVTNMFFVIIEGEASVSIVGNDGQDSKVAMLSMGDFFGELALLEGAPTSASVTASTELSTLVITQATFIDMDLKGYIENHTRRKIEEGTGRVAIRSPSPKTEEERQFIAEAIQRNKNLGVTVDINDYHLNAMIHACWKEEIFRNTNIITDGDRRADYFYVVQSGEFEVTRRSKNLTLIQPGGSFGELALLCSAPRSATVRALRNSHVWVFDRINFKRILRMSSAAKIAEYEKALGRIEVLQHLSELKRRELAEAMKIVEFSPGDEIMRQGRIDKSVYILLKGEVAISKDGHEIKRLVGKDSLEASPIFGEVALVKDAPRSATVTVVSSTASVLALDCASYRMVLGPLKDIIQSKTEQLVSKGETAHTCAGTAADQVKPEATEQVSLEASTTVPKSMHGVLARADLETVGYLRSGTFRSVEFCKHPQTGNTYVLKALNKDYVTRTGKRQAICNEKEVLMACNNPFIIRLYETYRTEKTLFFLLEGALGGDLCSLYQRDKLWGSEPHAKFYCAGVILAFDYLHNNSIFYRNLCLENVALDAAGNVKLVDLGLARFVKGLAYTMCGTVDYLAPEMIGGKGYDHAADWWALGILLFEIMSGSPPFHDIDDMGTMASIRSGILSPVRTLAVALPVKDLIKDLCKARPQIRLPMKPGGTDNIISHAWFKSFDWKSFKNHSMSAPYLPVASDINYLCSRAIAPTRSSCTIESTNASSSASTNSLSLGSTNPLSLDIEACEDFGAAWDDGFATFDESEEALSSLSPQLVPSYQGPGRAGLGAAASKGRIVLFGGHDGKRPLATTEVFEPSDDVNGRGRWTAASAMLGRRAYLSVGVLDGCILAVGGNVDGRALNTLEVFDVEKLTWGKGLTMPPMQTKRTLHASAVVDGRLFVCGGNDGMRDLNSLEAYDAKSNSWQAKLPMDIGRSYFGLVGAREFLYAIGGQDRRGSRVCAYRSVEVFDLWRERWMPGVPMSSPKGRLGLAAAVCVGPFDKEYIYVCGGSDGEEVLNTCERFDIDEGIWAKLPSMGVPRLGHSLVALNGKLYAIGGYDGKETPKGTFECFDPKAEKWGPLMKMGVQ